MPGAAVRLRDVAQAGDPPYCGRSTQPHRTSPKAVDPTVPTIMTLRLTAVEMGFQQLFALRQPTIPRL